jgi:hypothetical protein
VVEGYGLDRQEDIVTIATVRQSFHVNFSQRLFDFTPAIEQDEQWQRELSPISAILLQPVVRLRGREGLFGAGRRSFLAYRSMDHSSVQTPAEARRE